MTAAMIRAAARIVEERRLRNDSIVTFVELGSEGALLRLGAPMAREGECIIARNGEVSWRPK